MERAPLYVDMNFVILSLFIFMKRSHFNNFIALKKNHRRRSHEIAFHPHQKLLRFVIWFEYQLVYVNSDTVILPLIHSPMYIHKGRVTVLHVCVSIRIFCLIVFVHWFVQSKTVDTNDRTKQCLVYQQSSNRWD